MQEDHPWFKMYAKDWLGDPELRLCTPAARGLLEDIMCLCHLGKPYGYMTRRDGTKYTERELCKVLHYRPKQFRRLYGELLKRTRIIENGSGTYVPRLLKEREKSKQFSDYGRQGGHPELMAEEEQEPRTKKGKKKPGRFAYPPDFDEFWQVYPRPIGKRAALQKWLIAITGGVGALVMIEAAKKYAQSVEGEEMKYIKHPATWLHQGCWDDVLDKEQEKRRRDQSRRKARRKEYDKTMAEFVGYVKDNSAAERLLGANNLKELIERIGVDVKKQLGPNGYSDFRHRVNDLIDKDELQKGKP